MRCRHLALALCLAACATHVRPGVAFAAAFTLTNTLDSGPAFNALYDPSFVLMDYSGHRDSDTLRAGDGGAPKGERPTSSDYRL